MRAGAGDHFREDRYQCESLLVINLFALEGFHIAEALGNSMRDCESMCRAVYRTIFGDEAPEAWNARLVRFGS